ncbi:MAG TPA: CerR family C-terminal domain-containing protein, partial [Xanthobacteraceae bacterium]|nr:CerR family C-terminal domain-containing protein [Xanthobacteraceae bacterium]
MARQAKVTRVSKATREKIIKAASRAFALGGYEGASIRTIVAEADVNQAAINYHFGSKEGLYRAVLQAAVRALMSDGDAAEGPGTLSRKTALRRFVRGQLRPMTARDELSDYVRIFNWEALKPSPVFRQFMSKEAAPFLAGASALARRFLPEDATDEQAAIGALWLFGQCSIFVRNAE